MAIIRSSIQIIISFLILFLFVYMASKIIFTFLNENFIKKHRLGSAFKRDTIQLILMFLFILSYEIIMPFLFSPYIQGRINKFILPTSFLAILTTASLVYLYRVKCFFKGNLYNIQWIRKNKTKYKLLYDLPQSIVLAPAWEELILRVGLVLYFTEINREAEIAILISSLIFGFIHWFNHENKENDLIHDSTKASGNIYTHLDKADKILKSKNPSLWYQKKIIANLFRSFIGGYIAYQGIYHQSIMLMFVMHALWNSFVEFHDYLIRIIEEIKKEAFQIISELISAQKK